MKVKLILLIAVTLLMTHAISAQTLTKETLIWQDDVPNPVLQAFKSAYPKAQPRSYTKIEVNGVPLFYRIEIAEKALHWDVTYNPDGSVAKLEERIPTNELPAVAQKIIEEKYPKGSVARAEKVTRGGEIEYKSSVKSGGKSFNLVFDADGKLISSHEVNVTIVRQ